jgi:hypothetical protein
VLWAVQVWNGLEGECFCVCYVFSVADSMSSGRQQVSSLGSCQNQFCIKQSNSLERLEGYMNIPQEPKATGAGVPPAYWPASGELRVVNLCARYASVYCLRALPR